MTFPVGNAGQQAGGDAGQAPAEGQQQAPQEQNGQQQAAPAATETQGQAPSGDGGKTDKTDLSSLPQDVQDLIGNLRNEAANNRVQGKKDAQDAEKAAREKAYHDMGVTLGLVQPNSAADDAGAQQVAAQAAAQARELAVYRHAPSGIKVQALLDSRSFMDSISNIDPTDAAALTAAVKAAADKNPSFKVEVQTPQKSGGDLGGGSGEGQHKPSTLEGALSQHYNR